jgi:hypothetical protein
VGAFGVVSLLVSMLVAPSAVVAPCPVTDCPPARLIVAVRVPHAGHRAGIRVRVTDPAPDVVTGRLTVRLRGAHGTDDTYRAAYDGARVRIRTGRLAVGRYVAQVTFRPSADSTTPAMGTKRTRRVRR